MSSDYQQLALNAALEARGLGDWKRTNCPFCEVRTGKEDKRASWGFNTQTGKWSCWKCRAWGRIDLALIGLTAADPDTPQERLPEPGLPDSFMPLCEEPALGALIFQEARDYLDKRGVLQDVWAAANIGVCEYGIAANRIVVPVVDASGRCRGWVGRAWSKYAMLRYRYPRGMQRGELLWNAAALNVKTDEPVYVVEGVFDGLAQFPNAVACLGKPTHAQFPLLKKTLRPVVVALDGDAWMEGRALAQQLFLAGKQDVSYVRLPPKTDPGVMTRAQLKELRTLHV